MSQVFQISTLVVDNTRWFDLIAPINCNGFACRNTDSAPVVVGSSSTDADQQDTLPGGIEIVVPPLYTGTVCRFLMRSVVLRIKGTLTAGQVVKTNWVV